MWRPEKKIEYIKQPGSENPADICTKHVAREFCETHCRAMGCNFAFGKSDQGLSINFVEGIAADDAVLATWRREDLGSLCLRRPGRGGPHMKDIIRRNTINTVDSKIILEENADDINDKDYNQEYFDRPTDITTEFIYIPRTPS